MPVSPAKSPSVTAAKPAAVVEAPPLAPGAAPLCYVVDEDSSIRHFLSLVLHGSGIDTMEFPDGAAMRRSAETRVPDLIFHDVALDSADAIESMAALGERGFRGAVQLTSNRGAAVLDHVKSIGVEHKLKMLPVLKKPYETEAIVKIIQELKLGMPAATARIELEEALDNNWIEFWYQPKIDLRKKQLAGAEAYARARHPQHGIVLPGAFMPVARKRASSNCRSWPWPARSRPASFFPSSASISRSRSIFTPPCWTNCRSATSSRRIARAATNGRA